MAKFVTNLDLNFNELQNAVLNPVAEDPATLKEGMVWYNTAAISVRTSTKSNAIRKVLLSTDLICSRIAT